MMRLAWLATVLVLILAGGGGCRGKVGRREGGTDSTAAVSPGGSALDSAAAVDADTSSLAEASLDTLRLFTYSQRRGMRLFRHYCALCHGEEGKGDGFNAYNLDPRPRDLADSTYQAVISDQALREVVTLGGRGMNKSILMPAYDKTLTDDQITDLLAYLRTLAGPHSTEPPPETP